MADAKATALTTGSVLHTTDLLVGVDVADTTMAASGTTKRFSPAIVAAGLPVFGPSGGSHAQGLVPDPGASAGTSKFLREDASWVAPAGGSVFVGSGTGHSTGIVPDPGASAGTTRYLREDATWFAPPTGSGSTSPGGSPGQIQYNNAGAFGGAADWVIGSSGQLNGVGIADPGSPAAGDLWISTGQGVLSGVSAGVVWRAGGIIWRQQAPGTPVSNTLTQSSLLLGGNPNGTLTIPANAWLVGKVLRIRAIGSFSTASSAPALSIIPVLNGHNPCTSGAVTMTASLTSKQWHCDFWIMCQAIGASGAFVAGGSASFVSGASTAAPLVGIAASGTAGGAVASVPNDTTVPNAIDLTCGWNLANAANTVNVTAVVISLEG